MRDRDPLQHHHSRPGKKSRGRRATRHQRRDVEGGVHGLEAAEAGPRQPLEADEEQAASQGAQR